VESMKEGQKEIYYAKGKDIDSIKKLPSVEDAENLGYEYLCFTDPVDELLAEMFEDYKKFEFKSLSDADVSLGNKEFLLDSAEDQEVLDFVKEVLKDKVDEVVSSNKLKSHPVYLSSGKGITFEMEQYLRMSYPDSNIKAKKILELNLNHPALMALKNKINTDRDKAEKYAEILYQQGRLIAGLKIEDPSGYTDLICSLWKE